MSLKTTKASVVSFTSPDLPTTFLGGAKKFCLSMWLRFTNRENSYSRIFGQAENYGNDTSLFELRLHASARLLLRLSLCDASGARKYVSVVAPASANFPQPGVWTHYAFIYDSSLPTAQLTAYVNGVKDGYSTVQQGLPLFTPAKPVAITLNNVVYAETLDFARIAVYAGDSVPTAEEISRYVKTGVVPPDEKLLYLLEAPVDIKIPEGGTLLPDISSAYSLKHVAGTAVLTEETPGIRPSLQLKKAYLTNSGGALHTEWETVAGASGLDVFSELPCTFVSSAGDAVSPARFLWKNCVRWAVPADVLQAARQEGSLDFVIPEGAVYTTETTFSKEARGTVEIPSRQLHYPLPQSTRATLGTQGSNLTYYSEEMVLIDQSRIPSYWREGTVFNDVGIPQSLPGQTLTYTQMYPWTIQPKETLLVAWKGTDASKVYLDRAIPQNSTPALVQIRGEEYKAFYYTGQKSSILVVKCDAAGNTNITDFKVMLEQDLDRYNLGYDVSPRFLSNRAPFTYLRWMDAMGAVNCNAWDLRHVQPTHRKEVKSSLTETCEVESVTKIPPLPNGYLSAGNVYEVVTKTPHPFQTGQQVSFTKVSGIGHVYKVSDSVVHVRFGNPLIFGTPLGDLKCAISSLPQPKLLASIHNELYMSGGKCDTVWINIPHAATKELAQWYLQELDRHLLPQLKMVVEYSNETWNWAFEGQWRYSEGMAKLQGLTPSQFYAKKVKELYDMLPDKRHSVVCAGQSVTPTVLTSRMDALKALFTPEEYAVANIWMSVSNYHDFPLLKTTDSRYKQNREAVIQFSPGAVAELYDFGFRDLSAYKNVVKTYQKPLYGYEGGFAADMPSNDLEFTRSVFAAAFVAETASQQWQNYANAQASGFSGVCSLPERGRWNEATGKNWSTAISYCMDAGLHNELPQSPKPTLSELASMGSPRMFANWAWVFGQQVHSVEEWHYGDSTILLIDSKISEERQ